MLSDEEVAVQIGQAIYEANIKERLGFSPRLPIYDDVLRAMAKESIRAGQIFVQVANEMLGEIQVTIPTEEAGKE